MENLAQEAIQEIGKAIVGKKHIITQVMTAILANGHILIEDIPGVGKTTLALSFSRVLGLDYQRIQFTPDVMPADIAGFSMYKQGSDSFEYQEGAAITNLLLADEINRTSPKTQSALLEAMEEKKITVDGVTRELPDPYIVIATQNPLGSIGTHSLPESQLDRFMIKTSMGYPDRQSEITMLKQERVNIAVESLQELVQGEDLLEMRKAVEAVFIHDDLYTYVVDIANATRNSIKLELGLSPRGTIALMQMAKANAFLSGRDYLIPDDVKDVFLVTTNHRVLRSKEARMTNESVESILKGLLAAVPLDLAR
ncbi:MAG: MoxR family ATPase [Anaerostipes sp.]|jgi:MoxR-like ATPase|nr:MoxR family ATPase [Anaerostipes sp.]MDD3746051.1 MoxR family ATPase [Anaerostipes sp.]